MEPLTLRIYPDPILRRSCKKVMTFDSELRDLADAMIDTMCQEGGIGLAAPQVGFDKCLIIALRMADPEDTHAEPAVLINPKVVSSSSELWSYEEGCLSIPGVSASILRSVKVDIEFQDVDGDTHRSTEEGMFARILQHEIDHLNGRLFIDYLSDAQKSLLRNQLKKLADSHTAS